jgi:hypothetical protein
MRCPNPELAPMGSDITVSGKTLIEADRGTVTIDQSDPAGPTPLITLNGQIVSEILNVTGAGDVTIGGGGFEATTFALSAAHDLTWDGSSSTKFAFDSPGNATVSAGNDLSILNDTTIWRINGGQTDGLNIELSAGNNLTFGGNLTLRTQPGGVTTGGNISILAGTTTSGGSITAVGKAQAVTAATIVRSDMGTGANIKLDADGSITLGSLTGSVTVAPPDFSTNGTRNVGPPPITLTNGGNIDVITGGDFTAADTVNGVDLVIDTSGGSTISTGGNITLNIGGNLLVSGGGPLTLYVLNQNGGHIGTGGNISVNTGTGSVTAGNIDVFLDNSDGGSIGSEAKLTFHAGPVTTVGFASFQIANGANLTSAGGTINSNATIDFSAGNVTNSADANGNSGFFADINNRTGQINGNATIMVHGADFQVNDTFDNTMDNGAGVVITGKAVIDVTASSITETARANAFGSFLISSISNEGGTIDGKASINYAVTGDITVEGAEFSIKNTVDDESKSGPGSIGGDATIMVKAANITTDFFLNAYIENTTGTFGGAQTVTIQSDGFIHIGGNLAVLGQVSAGLDVMAGTLSSTDVTAGTAINVGTGGIKRYAFPPAEPHAVPAVPNVLHTLSAPIVTSHGGINFNGIAADGDLSPATDAGALTINASSLSFGSEANIRGSVTFNGGDGSSTFAPGNGGTFTVNTTNNISVDSDIEATSGYFQPIPVGGSVTPSGDGGTVNLNSTNGTVTVNNRIEVSSAEPTSTAAPFRQSAKGGNIGITSGKASAVAINIGSTAQLLSYLGGAAAGPGGTITISATGNNSTINVNNTSGLIEADRGEIDIQNHGAAGLINITNANMSADVIKIQVLGLDGTLKIGGGIISADSALNLYAAGSNGAIEFTASVTLSSGVAAVIAANTVTIDNSVTVTINSPVVAQVFTNNPHYAISSGGNGSTTGVFAGTGAPTTTQPFPPPGGPGAAATTTSSTSSTSSVSKQSQTTVASASTIPTGSQLKKHTLSAASGTTKNTLAARQLVLNSAVSPRRHTSLAAAKTTINVANSAQLSSMLESATESGNKVTYVAKPQSRGSSSPGTSSAGQITPASGASGGNVPAKGGNDANVAMDRVTNFTNTNLGRPVNTASY